MVYYSGFSDLNSIKSIDGKNICHIAAFLGYTDIVAFLRNETYFNCYERDDYGLTPYDESVVGNHDMIKNMLEIR